jgi:hypothetical protein
MSHGFDTNLNSINKIIKTFEEHRKPSKSLPCRVATEMFENVHHV